MAKAVPLLFAVLIAASLAGCAKEPNQGVDTTSPTPMTGSGTTGTTGTSTGKPVVPPSPLNIEWSDCEGIGLFLHATALVHNGTVPPGWEAPASSALGGIQLILYECQRMSWGSFERGPVHVLHEWHGKYTEPASCNQEGEDYDLRNMIQAIWLDDAEIVEFARQSFGLPFHYAEFGFSSTALGGAQELTWTFQPPGHEQSAIHFVDFVEINHTSTTDYRLYWYDGAAVSYLSLLNIRQAGEEVFNPAYGTLAPPTLYGEGNPTQQFAAPASELHGHASMSATIHRFGDLQCKNPL